MNSFRHLDLFSGIGGFALAASWVWGEQHEIVSFCEIEPFPQKVLKKHWPAVPVHDDIKTMKGNSYGRIDLISGGFPCQPYSCAGKQKGKEDDRALWPEMFRIIKEAKPNWVIGENVAGFVNMGLDDSLSDLESEGYETTAFIIPACSVNAPHRRDRVWIVAHAGESIRLFNKESQLLCKQEKTGQANWGIGTNSDATNPKSRKPGKQAKQERRKDIGGRNIETISDTESRERLQGYKNESIINSRKPWKINSRDSWNEPWIEVATRLCGMDDGISGRVDRLKSLGNAIVPQVVYPIMQAIKQIEKEQK